MKPCKLKLMQRLRVNLLFNFPGVFLWNIGRKEKRLRRRYCHKGIHKLRRVKESFQDSSGKKNFNYFTCVFCNYRIFTTGREFERYKKYKEGQDARLKKCFSELLKHPSEPKSKRYVGDGRCDGGEVSTRKLSGKSISYDELEIKKEVGRGNDS